MISIGDSIFVTENLNGASNVGIIIGKKGVIIVDSTFFPVKMRRIEEFIHRVTKQVILYVINTHYHLDHVLGNCAVDVPIVGSELTKKYLENFDFDSFKTSMDPIVQRELKEAKIVPPSVTFKNRMNFDLGDKKVEIFRLGGHTPDSTVVFVKPEKVCFCGDLVFAGYHAEIDEDSDLERWILALDKVKKMEPTWIVPGHGKVSGTREIDDMKSYLKKFKEISRLVKMKETRKVVDRFADDPSMSKRGFALLFEESLLKYVKRRGKDGKNFGTHKA